MAASVENITWATPEHGRCATHRAKRLSCEQMDELVERSGYRCEICGANSAGGRWGVLQIDHDPLVGYWAVRGLLCGRCNVTLRYDRRITPTPEATRYVANPWWAQACKRAGKPLSMPPEPAVGSSLRWSGYRWTRVSADNTYRWFAHVMNSESRKTWSDLWYSYGPLLMGEITFRDQPPRWSKSSPWRSDPVHPVTCTKQELASRIQTALNIARKAQWNGEMLIRPDEIIAALTGTKTGGG